MSQPPDFVITANFAQEEATLTSGRSSVRTSALDATLRNAKSTLDAVLVNLLALQRDDLAPRDGIVGVSTLAADALALISSGAFRMRGAWVTVTVYSLGDIVSNAGVPYICILAHTSGVFATDLAASKWVIFAKNQTASQVPFSPTVTILSTDVQAAIQAVDLFVRTKLLTSPSVADAGGDPTGVADSTAAIQSVIDSVSMAGGGVYLPAGTYKITDTLTISAAKFVEIVGVGMRGVTLDWRGANNKPMILVNSSTTTSCPAVKDLTLYNGGAAAGITGIQFNPAAGGVLLQPIVERVLFNSLAKGIKAYGECDEVLISDCWVFGCTDGIEANTGAISNWTLLRNHYQGVPGTAVNLVGSGHQLIGQTIQHALATGAGIKLDGFDSCAIVGGYFESSIASGTSGPAINLGATGYGGDGMSGIDISGFHIDFAGAIAGQIGIKTNYVKGMVIGGGVTMRGLALGIQLGVNCDRAVINPIALGSGVTTKIQDLGATRTLVLDPDMGGVSLGSGLPVNFGDSARSLESTGVNIIGAAIGTLFAVAANEVYDVVIKNENAGYWAKGMAVRIGAGALAVLEEYNSNANLRLVASGNNVAANQLVVGAQTISYTATRRQKF